MNSSRPGPFSGFNAMQASNYSHYAGFQESGMVAVLFHNILFSLYFGCI